MKKLMYGLLILMVSCQKADQQKPYSPKVHITQNGVEITPNARLQSVSDSLGRVLVKSFGLMSSGRSNKINEKAVKLIPDKTPDYAPIVPEYDCQCGYGNYIIRGINSGSGSFVFNATFAYGANGVSQFKLFLSGYTVGFTWTTADTYYNSDKTSGVTYGTAQYSMLGVNFNYAFAFEWSVQVNGNYIVLTHTWKDVSN